MTLTKAEQSEATTRRLLDVARQAFGARGYADASLEDMVSEAGLTRGALYHHFHNKRALFEAVFLDLQAEIASAINTASSTETEPFRQLVQGCRAFLMTVAQPAFRRIVLQDAPAVLGAEVWRRADETYSTNRLRQRIIVLARAGEFRGLDPNILTAFLNGAMNDAALLVARSQTPEATLADVLGNFETLLRRLRQA